MSPRTRNVFAVESDVPDKSEDSKPAAQKLSGPLSLGIISGPGYHNKKGGLDKLLRVLSDHPEIVHHHVDSPPAVADAVDDLLSRNIDIIGISGGDGTLGMVVTDVIRRKDLEKPPYLAALAGGRTNMSHGDLGLKGEPHKSIRRLIEWAANPIDDAKIISRTALSLRTMPEDIPLYGFFVGAAAIYRASRVIWDNRNATKVPGMKTVLGTAVHVSTLLTRLVIGQKPFDPTKIEVTIDGQKIEEENFTVLFLTTLDRMALGFKPFWGKSTAPLRLTTIAHSHRRLLLATIGGLRGKPNRFLTREHGFESHTGDAIELLIYEPVTLDGEVIEPHEGRPLMVASGPKLAFVRV